MNLIVTDLASRETASIKTGAAHEIEFVIGDCALGKVLVARSPIGVCAIRFGSTAGEVEQDLAASFRDSRIFLNNRRLRDDLTKVVQFIAVPRDRLDLDLDIRGTPFQCRVWDALRTIAFGKPLTYAQLARRVSGPNRYERSLKPALRTRSPWQSPVIASWATVDRWRVIVGASNASRR